MRDASREKSATAFLSVLSASLSTDQDMLALFSILASDSPKWWDYPGFELWKFFNLALFVGLLVYVLLRANIGQAFRTRGETIKAELEKGRQERDAALAKLKEAEER